MMMRIRSENRVMRKANPLAAGFNRFEISHKISSTRTAESEIVAEKVTAAMLLKEMFRNEPSP